MIELFYSFESEHLGDLYSIYSLEFGLVIELVSQKSSPINVLFELEARVANIASMKRLLKYKLTLIKIYISMLTVPGVKLLVLS